MATMCLPFQEVEFQEVKENVTFVSSGIRRAVRKHALRAYVCKALLIPAFHDIVQEQDGLIAKLNTGIVQTAPPEDLTEVAIKLEDLVASGRDLIETSHRVGAPFFWTDYLERMEAQIERFDSLAESYRLSASEKYVTYVGGLVNSANETANESWSEFVASLHD